MKKYLGTLVSLVMFGFGSQAFGGLDEVHIRSISYGGTGCPQGSVGELLAADKKSFTLLFDEYIAEIGRGIDRKESRKFCQVTLDLFVPQGYQYTIAKFDYRGFADLERGVTGTQTSTYYFDRNREGTFSKSFYGPVTEEYKFSDNIGISSLVWSKCGEKRLLNVKTQMNLRSRGAYGLMTTDSIDGSVKQVFGIQWRRCR